MFRRKRRRDLFDSFFEDIDDLFERIGESDVLESGYSISVTQGPEGTKVHVKAGKGTDVESLRKDLQQRYPDAEIHIEGGTPLIREISSKTLEEEKKKSKKGVWFKPE